MLPLALKPALYASASVVSYISYNASRQLPDTEREQSLLCSAQVGGEINNDHDHNSIGKTWVW